MRKAAHVLSTAASVTALLVSMAMVPFGSVQAADGDKKMTPAEEGKKLAWNRKKGNCLACHKIEGAAVPGNIGPPLVAMKARFPDKAKLRAQIWDATTTNPNTMMPPFGRHKILKDSDIDKIVEYMYTL